MDILSWISVFSIISVVIGLLLVSKPTMSEKSAYLILLNVATLAYLAGNIVYFIDSNLVEVLKWLKLITLTSLLSALFGLVQSSKPIFARFPSFLIYLPFITLFFFPLITDKTILSDLLFGTFQAGSILVALMVFGIHQLKSGKHLWMLFGVTTFLIAFIIFWFVPMDKYTALILTEILVIAGIIEVSFGIKNIYKN